MRAPRARMGGFAALAAILTAAMVASIAAFLSWQGTLAMRQSENMAAARQATALARASVSQAAAVIARDEPRFDHAGEAWAKGLPPLEEGDARVTAAIADEQARFNVNVLTTGRESGAVALRRLLAGADVPVALADAIVDWLDADDVPSEPNGAEDTFYLGLDVPYRTANRVITDIAELRLVKGMTDERFARLAPHITALPPSALVNVNTAGPLVLQAVLPGLTASDVASLLASRAREPLLSRTEFGKRLPASAISSANDLLDVRSEHFEVRGVVRSGRITSGYRALVGRQGPSVLAFSREFG